MVNLHLLRKELTVEMYNQIMSSRFYSPEWQSLPAYIIARCPYCLVTNIEKLNTYTTYKWSMVFPHNSVKESVYSLELVEHHCEHFSLVQSFLNVDMYDGYSPDPGYVSPYVIGHLIQADLSLAVMHALPICRIENNDFIPRYTLFMISYFSEYPQEVVRAVQAYNSRWYSLEASGTLYLPLQFGRKYWADLLLWVREGKLYWVDSDDPNLSIRTHDVDAFPYGNLTSDS